MKKIVVALAVASPLLAAAQLASTQGPSNMPPLNVNVANTPLPVSGTVNIGGLPATPLNVNVTNTSTSPANVKVTNTVSVDAPYETQLLFDQVMTSSSGPATISVAAYKTVHIDFALASGTCLNSGASLSAFDTAHHLLTRATISANETCVSSFTGKTIEIPGRSLTLSVAIPNTNDQWLVVVYGRAN